MKINKKHCIHVALSALCAQRPRWKLIQRAETPTESAPASVNNPHCLALLCDMTAFELAFTLAATLEEQECSKQDKVDAYRDLKHSCIRYIGCDGYLVYWPHIHY